MTAFFPNGFAVTSVVYVFFLFRICPTLRKGKAVWFRWQILRSKQSIILLANMYLITMGDTTWIFCVRSQNIFSCIYVVLGLMLCWGLEWWQDRNSLFLFWRSEQEGGNKDFIREALLNIFNNDLKKGKAEILRWKYLQLAKL